MRCGLYRAHGDAIKILTKQPGRGTQTWLRSPRRRFYSLVAIKTEYTGKKKRPYNTTFVVVVGSFIHTYIVITRRGPPILCYKLFYYFFVRPGRGSSPSSSCTAVRCNVYDDTCVRPRSVRRPSVRPSRTFHFCVSIIHCPQDRFVSAVFTRLYMFAFA